MKKQQSAKKSGTQKSAPLSAKAPAAKKTALRPVAKKAKPPLVEKPQAPVVVGKPRVEQSISVAQVMNDALAQVTARPTLHMVEKPQDAPVEQAGARTPRETVKPHAPLVTEAPRKPRLLPEYALKNVKLRKVEPHADDVAEGDKAAPGRFEVLMGDVRVGEVAFRSVPRIKDGTEKGFRHYWQGEDARGTVVFTDCKRMMDAVGLIVDVVQGRIGVPVDSPEIEMLADMLVGKHVPEEVQ